MSTVLPGVPEPATSARAAETPLRRIVRDFLSNPIAVLGLAAIFGIWGVIATMIRGRRT